MHLFVIILADGHHLGSLECVVGKLLLDLGRRMNRDELDVHFGSASYLCLRVVAHFNPCLSVGHDYVPSNVRLRLNASR